MRTFSALLVSTLLGSAAVACGEDPNLLEPACAQLILCCDDLIRTSVALNCDLNTLPEANFQCEIDLRLAAEFAQEEPLPATCTPTGSSTVAPPGM